MFDALAAAGILREAETSGQISSLPLHLRPSTREEAYQVQDAFLGHGALIGAWKVAPVPDGEVPQCAPILSDRIVEDGFEFPASRFPTPEFEIEIGLLMTIDLPSREEPYSAEDIARAAIVLPCIEVLSSRFTDRKAVSPLEALADAKSNAAVVKGSATVELDQVNWADVEAIGFCDGLEIGRRGNGKPRIAVLETVAWLANEGAVRLGGLKKGQIVITGARLKPFRGYPGQDIVGELTGVGQVGCRIGR